MSKMRLYSVCDSMVNAPAGELDLPRWLFRMTDEEYQSCAKGHLGCGSSTNADGKQTSVNVESVGGHLMIQHYLPEASSADHLTLVSRSKCWLFHVWPVHIRVAWDLKLVPTSKETCVLRNTVLVEHDFYIMKVLVALVFGAVFLRRHNEEETPNFARLLGATKLLRSMAAATPAV